MKKKRKTSHQRKQILQLSKNQNMIRDLSLATGTSTRKQTQMDTKQKELNQVQSKKLKRLISKMMLHSNQSHLISQVITSLVSIRVKLRLRPLENIPSAPHQMMDQDFGLMKRKLSITGVSMVHKNEKAGSISKLDTTTSEQPISRTKEELP